jgi:hypothetical protein
MLAVAFAAIFRDKTPPQIVTLPNGERYRFVAAVWSKHQVPPTIFARFCSRLPAGITKLLPLRIANYVGPVPTFTTPQPRLELWFQLEGPKSSQPLPIFRGVLEDEHGVAAGECAYPSLCSLGNVTWLTIGSIPALPRRSRVVTCRLIIDSPGDPEPHREIGVVRFPNPVFGHFPQWQPETSPETLPVTKTAGDVRVRLTEFIVAAENNGIVAITNDGKLMLAHKGSVVATNDGKMTCFHQPGAFEKRQVVFKAVIETARGTNAEPWLIQHAELSDATGNRISTDSCSRWSVTDEYHFGPALWQDEAAWRLTLDLEKSRDFESEELVTFTNVPVPAMGATNVCFQTNTIRGVPIVLRQEFTREASNAVPVIIDKRPPPTRLTLELLNPPEGFVADFFRLNSDTGWTTQWYNARQPGMNSATTCFWAIPVYVRTLDLTWAIQKERRVEFLIRPPQVKRQREQ